MRVSKVFSLGRSQDELDFVDIDMTGDTPVFIDPRALRLLNSAWGHECVSLIQNYFQHVLDAIRQGKNYRARRLLQGLSEPNETHLGLSQGRSRGRGIGAYSAKDVWEALCKSEAVATGLLEDLEDTILFIRGIGTDLISDMTTNIIREPLIRYTQKACEYYGIETKVVDSGPLWDPLTGEWFNRFEPLPVTNHRKLLFVPKVIVRRKVDYDPDEYMCHYVLTYLQGEEIRAKTELVRLLKDGTPWVAKKDLIKKYGNNKETAAQITQKFPEILESYRKAKKTIHSPLSHNELALVTDTPFIDWDKVLHEVVSLNVGQDDAIEYENRIEKLLTPLFYPHLVFPMKQVEIHNGRKRIDITYDNAAKDGFFHWVGMHYVSSHIFIECKNYTGDPKNPELDQMAGRFSLGRGQVGIIVCRKIINKKLFAQRCRDTANDQRGYIMTLDDEDLTELVNARKSNSENDFRVLREKFNNLVM
jgi:hypothetical protein